MSPRRTLLATLLLLALPAAAHPQGEAPPSDAPRRDQAIGARGLSDHGYGYGLYRLDPRWQFLDDAAAANAHPKGVGGVFDPVHGASLLVLAHGAGDLAQVSSRALHGLPLLERKVETRAPIQVEGLAGLRLEGSGRRPGGQRIRFGLTFLPLHGRVIELQALSPGGEAIETLWGSFHTLPAKTAPGRTRAPLQRRGAGWRATGGVLETVRGGVRIEAPPGWRLDTPDELAAEAASSEARLMHRGRFVTLNLTFERAGDAEASTLDEAFRAMVKGAKHESEVLAWSQTPLAGSAATLVTSRAAQGPWVVARGQACVEAASGRLLIGVFATWDPTLGAEGERLLRAALEGVRLLSSAEVRDLARETTAAPHGISLDQHLSGGELRDHAMGLAWKLPPGTWRARLAEVGKSPLLRCALHDPARGLRAHLRYVRPAPGESPTTLHERLLAEIKDARPIGPSRLERGLRLSWLEREQRGISERVLLATRRDGPHALALLAWGARADVAPVQSALATELTQLQFKKLPAHETKEGVLTYHRLGFRLRPPQGFSARVREAEAALKAWGGRAELIHAKREGWLGVIARAEPHQPEAALKAGDQAWLAPLRERVGAFQRGDVQEIGGRPCEHLWGKGPAGDRCDVFRVPGRTRTLVLMTDRAGRHPRESGLLGAFEFLD